MQDVRSVVRTLLAEKIATGVAVLTLAVGIGASTAVFTVVSSIILRPLPVAEPDRLARLYLGDPQEDSWAYRVWQDIDGRSGDTFAGAFASSRMPVEVGVAGESRFVEGLWASGGLFETLGVQALLGRVITRADDRHGCGADGPVAVVSHRFWQDHVGGGGDVIGRQLPVNGTPFTVIGVTPPTFFGPTVGRTFDVAVPLGCESLVRGRRSLLDNQPLIPWLHITLRRHPYQSLSEATAIVRSWQPAIREAAMPERMTAAGRERYLREPMVLLPAGDGGASTLWQRYRSSLLALLVVGGLLFVVACANIANLMLARAVSRRREVAVRVALGGTPWQVARLALLESTLLSAAGGGLGLMLGHGMTRLLVVGLSQRAGEVFVDVSPDWRVAAFTLAAASCATLLCGVAPALRAGRVAPRAALAEHGRPGGANTRFELDRAILVGQVALTLVLVVTAGLFARTFMKLTILDAGVDPDRVLLVTPHSFGTSAAVSREERLRRYDRIRAAVREIPGVSHTAVSFPTPLSANTWRAMLDPADAPEIAEEERWVDAATVSPDWFATYGVPLLRGRDFREDDQASPRPVVIVNDAFVSRYFETGRDPLGRTIGVLHEPDQRHVIIGVVGNVVSASLRDSVRPAVYFPLGQDGQLNPVRGAFAIYTALSGIFTVGVRAERGSPAALAGSVVGVIRTVDPSLASEVRTLATQVDGTLRQERLAALVAGLFGGMALLLAAVGLYGVTLLAMRRQRVATGIRMALGATRGRVLGEAVRRVLRVVGIGVAVGALVSLVVGRALGTLLYGLEPHDPATLALATVVLVLAGVGAGLAAAAPAARVEPSQVLRQG